jgi:hypothetical protein
MWTRLVGECADKEDRVRSILVIVVALLLNACSFIGRMDFNAPSLDPSKIYLNATTVVSVSRRESYRYACIDPPLLCVQHGLGFECRCP